MGKLTKGRSVLVITPFHYNGEDTHPGIVTRVWVECEPGDPAGSYINVTVLPDANLPFVATSVHLFDTREQAMAHRRAHAHHPVAYWPVIEASAAKPTPVAAAPTDAAATPAQDAVDQPKQA